MEERRKDNESIQVAIAEIKGDVRYIKERLTRSVTQFDEHVKTSEGFRDKVTRLENVRDQLDAHIIADKWLFGLMFTMQVAILTKLIGVW